MITVVTDLGYGDAGKGSVVDFLCRQTDSALVVRHNGGPQAGHNVITANGEHHCFSQFGAGSLAGAKTFLSRYMLVNPLNQIREADHLIELGEVDIWDRTFVDENCIIITPWHTAINRLQELARGAGRHGSCGQGIGVAMKQSLDPHGLTVRVKDIADPGFWPRLEAMHYYLRTTYAELAGDNPHWTFMQDEGVGKHLVDRYQEWSRTVTVVPSNYLAAMARDHEQTVFEGAQGVLLDEWYGFHPYTTWSTCTHENALTLLREVDNLTTAGDGQVRTDNQRIRAVPGSLSNPIRLGVIRAVTTRHGAGPHPTEDPVLTAAWSEPHNVDDPWQGSFRVGPLDLVAHRYASTLCGGVDQVVVTHLDRSERWRYCNQYEGMPKIPLGRRGDLEGQERITRGLEQARPILTGSVSEDELLAAIEHNVGPIGITSYGPTAEDKRVVAAKTGASASA